MRVGLRSGVVAGIYFNIESSTWCVSLVMSVFVRATRQRGLVVCVSEIVRTELSRSPALSHSLSHQTDTVELSNEVCANDFQFLVDI